MLGHPSTSVVIPFHKYLTLSRAFSKINLRQLKPPSFSIIEFKKLFQAFCGGGASKPAKLYPYKVLSLRGLVKLNST